MAGISMRFAVKALIGLSLLLGLCGPARADSTAQRFLDGVKAYQAGQYQKAADAFLAVARSGIANPGLYYNLGNAYLKAGKLGHAILWYERALKLAPQDPDLRFNYQYALSQTQDERAEEGLDISRILFFWQDRIGPHTLRWLALGLNGLFWLVLLIRRLQGKKPFKPFAHLLLIPAVLFALTVFYQEYQAGHQAEAVVVSAEVSVRSGLSRTATELFVLHAGTKVRIQREKAGFARIYFSKGKIGWVEKSALRRI